MAPQLFDLTTDPGELMDLAPTSPAAVAALDAQLRTLIDYPAVALDVAAYQKQQLRWWVNNTPGWEKEVVKQRWQASWEEAPGAAMKALKAYLANDTIALLPCNGALATS